MKYKTLILIVVLDLLLSGCSGLMSKKTGFDDSGYTYFVKTKNLETEKTNYYECNLKGQYRKCGKFNSGKCKILLNAHDGYEENNDYLYVAHAPKVYFDPVDKNHILETDRIFKYGDEYYVSFWYNVNLHTPYGLFKYDSKNKTLNQILYIDDEEITEIKMP